MSEIEREFRAITSRLNFIVSRVRDRTDLSNETFKKLLQIRDAIQAEYGPRLAREIYYNEVWKK